MSNEPVLSDKERTDILSGMSHSNVPASDVEKGTAGSPDLKSFGALLEESLKNRQAIDLEEQKAGDELRNKVIEESRLDLIGKIFR